MRALVAVRLLSNSARADYQVTEIGRAAIGISDAGTVTGITEYATNVGTPAATPGETFSWSGGISQTIGLNYSAQAINSSGIVVGEHFTTGMPHVARWDGNTVTDLGAFDAADPISHGISAAFGINDAGVIVGRSRTMSTWIHAFIWDGTMIDISPDAASPNRWHEAYDINNAGVVVGRGQPGFGEWGRGFIWTQSTGMQYLGTLGGDESTALDINESGLVAGFATDVDGYAHAAIWQGDTIVDLGMAPVPAGMTGENTADINELGQAVFTFTDGNGAYFHALYDGGPTSFDQASNLIWIDDVPGLSLYTTNGINNSGQIVGIGFDESGHDRGFVLTVAPEPSSIVLLAIGLLVVGLTRRLHTSQ